MPKQENSKYVYIGVIVALVIILGFVFISNQQTSTSSQSNSNNYNIPQKSNTPVISLTEAKQIATNKAYSDIVSPHPDYQTAITESYLENNNWMVKIKFWIDEDWATTSDRRGWYITYVIDGNTGKIIRENR